MSIMSTKWFIFAFLCIISISQSVNSKLPYATGRKPQLRDEQLSYRLEFNPVQTHKTDKLVYSMEVSQTMREGGSAQKVARTQWYPLTTRSKNIYTGNIVTFPISVLMDKIREQLGDDIEYATIRIKMEDRSTPTRPKIYISESININHKAVETPRLLSSDEGRQVTTSKNQPRQQQSRQRPQTAKRLPVQPRAPRIVSNAPLRPPRTKNTTPRQTGKDAVAVPALNLTNVGHGPPGIFSADDLERAYNLSLQASASGTESTYFSSGSERSTSSNITVAEGSSRNDTTTLDSQYIDALITISTALPTDKPTSATTTKTTELPTTAKPSMAPTNPPTTLQPSQSPSKSPTEMPTIHAATLKNISGDMQELGMDISTVSTQTVVNYVATPPFERNILIEQQNDTAQNLSSPLSLPVPPESPTDTQQMESARDDVSSTGTVEGLPSPVGGHNHITNYSDTLAQILESPERIKSNRDSWEAQATDNGTIEDTLNGLKSPKALTSPKAHTRYPYSIDPAAPSNATLLTPKTQINSSLWTDPTVLIAIAVFVLLVACILVVYLFRDTVCMEMYSQSSQRRLARQMAMQVNGDDAFIRNADEAFVHTNIGDEEREAKEEWITGNI